MALLGKAALAMWWSMAPDMLSEFEDWHSHEHFPERLAIPGFRRASRWTSATGDEGVFVMYELDSHAVLSSRDYLASLNAPSPWSTQMMPHHRHMVRCQSRVLESAGGAVARQALTVRLSPTTGRDDELRASLRSLVGTLPGRPGSSAPISSARGPTHRPDDGAEDPRLRSGGRLGLRRPRLRRCSARRAGERGVVGIVARRPRRRTRLGRRQVRALVFGHACRRCLKPSIGRRSSTTEASRLALAAAAASHQVDARRRGTESSTRWSAGGAHQRSERVMGCQRESCF